MAFSPFRLDGCGADHPVIARESLEDPSSRPRSTRCSWIDDDDDVSYLEIWAFSVPLLALGEAR
jgi:hypothetical protein